MMKQRLFGSRNIPKIAKYAVVIYIYTHESRHDLNSWSAQAKAKATTKRMTRKLIQRIKGSKYDFDPGNTNHLWSEHVESMLSSKEFRDKYQFGVFMLTVNQFMHEIIHNYCQDYDPADTDAKKPDFFKAIYDELVEESQN